VVFILGSTLLSVAQNSKPLALMPMPAQVQQLSGQLLIDSGFTVSIAGHADPRVQKGVDRFLNDLRLRTGLFLVNPKPATGATASLTIQRARVSKETPKLGEAESYTLEVGSTGAKLPAPTTLGALHGLQTFLQLVENTPQGFAVLAVSIQDAPRFPWRGLMID